MYKLRSFLPLNVMKNVYDSLIYPHIMYAIEAWGSACKTELDKIFIHAETMIHTLLFLVR